MIITYKFKDCSISINSLDLLHILILLKRIVNIREKQTNNSFLHYTWVFQRIYGIRKFVALSYEAIITKTIILFNF